MTAATPNHRLRFFTNASLEMLAGRRARGFDKGVQDKFTFLTKKVRGGRVETTFVRGERSIAFFTAGRADAAVVIMCHRETSWLRVAGAKRKRFDSPAIGR